MTDIFKTLREDHDRQRALLDRVADTSGDSEERREAFGELARELLAHAKAEERTLYAEMLGHRETQDETAHSVHEHEQIESLTDELLDKDMSSPGWIATFKKLAERVRHHVDEEEEDTFAAGQELLDEDAAKELGARFREAKSEELRDSEVEVGR